MVCTQYTHFCAWHLISPMSKCIKGDGSVMRLTEDPAALRIWMLAGPEISRVVAEFEESMGDDNIITIGILYIIKLHLQKMSTLDN